MRERERERERAREGDTLLELDCLGDRGGMGEADDCLHNNQDKSKVLVARGCTGSRATHTYEVTKSNHCSFILLFLFLLYQLYTLQS